MESCKNLGWVKSCFYMFIMHQSSYYVEDISCLLDCFSLSVAVPTVYLASNYYSHILPIVFLNRARDTTINQWAGSGLDHSWLWVSLGSLLGKLASSVFWCKCYLVVCLERSVQSAGYTICMWQCFTHPRSIQFSICRAGVANCVLAEFYLARFLETTSRI